MHEIREIWSTNFEKEMNLIDYILTECQCTFIAIDIEFPGFLRLTPRFASEERLYRDMKSNVENTKMIQFGFTFFDAGGNIGSTWEVNFSNFGETWDAQSDDSIEFLTRNGLNLRKIREDGIDVNRFFMEFLYLVCIRRGNLTWVTFHGIYDLAYLVNNFNGNLPGTAGDFAELVGKTFGYIYDVKYMARKYKELGQQLGLEKLAQKLKIHRIGPAHHAGSDSLLTAGVFLTMVKEFEGMKEAGGFIYGISTSVYPQNHNPQTWHYNGVSVSSLKVSCDYSALDNPVPCDYSGLISYNPQMYYNDSGGLVSYSQTLSDGFSHSDPWNYYKGSSDFDSWINCKGVLLYPSCGLDASATAQIPYTLCHNASKVKG